MALFRKYLRMAYTIHAGKNIQTFKHLKILQNGRGQQPINEGFAVFTLHEHCHFEKLLYTKDLRSQNYSRNTHLQILKSDALSEKQVKKIIVFTT